MRIFAVALLLGLGLAGCSGPQVVQTGSPSTRIDSLYNYGVSGRDLKLTVLGTAFGYPNSVLAQAVEPELQVALQRPATRPTVQLGPSARPGYGVVLAFDGGPSLSGQDLCDGRLPPFPSGRTAGEDRVTVVAAFCVAGAAKTAALGSVAATGPDDRQFRQLMGQIMLTLFRPDDFEGHRGPRVVP